MLWTLGAGTKFSTLQQSDYPVEYESEISNQNYHQRGVLQSSGHKSLSSRTSNGDSCRKQLLKTRSNRSSPSSRLIINRTCRNEMFRSKTMDNRMGYNAFHRK